MFCRPCLTIYTSVIEEYSSQFNNIIQDPSKIKVMSFIRYCKTDAYIKPMGLARTLLVISIEGEFFKNS